MRFTCENLLANKYPQNIIVSYNIHTSTTVICCYDHQIESTWIPKFLAEGKKGSVGACVYCRSAVSPVRNTSKKRTRKNCERTRPRMTPKSRCRGCGICGWSANFANRSARTEHARRVNAMVCLETEIEDVCFSKSNETDQGCVLSRSLSLRK